MPSSKPSAVANRARHAHFTRSSLAAAAAAAAGRLLVQRLGCTTAHGKLDEPGVKSGCRALLWVDHTQHPAGGCIGRTTGQQLRSMLLPGWYGCQAGPCTAMSHNAASFHTHPLLCLVLLDVPCGPEGLDAKVQRAEHQHAHRCLVQLVQDAVGCGANHGTAKWLPFAAVYEELKSTCGVGGECSSRIADSCGHQGTTVSYIAATGEGAPVAVG